MAINERIRAYIQSKGWKQSYIAEKSGITANKLSSILNGKRKISAMEYLDLCEALEVDPRKFEAEKEA